MDNNFSKREVLISFRRFNDLRSDVETAKPQCWIGALKGLLRHCTNDPVMRVVTAPLNLDLNDEIERWHEDVEQNEGGTFNLITLPENDDDKVAFLYQLLKKIVDGSFNYQGFCVGAFNSTDIDDVVNVINSEFIRKFTREVGYRLKSIKSDIKDEQLVSCEVLNVFHVTGPFQNIHGGIHGGFAAQNSTITDNKLTYNDPSQFAQEVKDLGEKLDDVLQEHKESVAGAFALLVRAIETNTVPKPVEVAAAVQAINEGSPSGLKRLGEIMDGAAGNVLGNLLTPMFAFYLGIKQP